MDTHRLMGVHITERVEHAGDVQQVLTRFGCQIRTRLGLHEADAGVCSPNGLILLDLVDDEAVTEELKAALTAIEGVDVQTMVFDHA